MTPEEKAEFVRTHHRAVLVTRRSGDRLQSSPIVCAADDEGKVVISVTAGRAKTKNLRRRNRATLCVLPDDFFGEWVQIDGRAEVVDLPEAMDGLISLTVRCRVSTPTGTSTVSRWSANQRCLVRITIDG